MPVTATNIIAGPAVLYRADFGATEPLDTAVSTPPAAPWVDLGATDDGATLNVETEWFKKRMDQTTMSPGSMPTNREITVVTNLAEGTLENFALALNQLASSITSGGTGPTAWRALEAGGEDPGEEPPYSALIMRGRGPNGIFRNFIIRKALSIESVESAYKKDDQWLIPVTFAAHWVSSSIKPFKIQEQGPAV